MSDFDVLKVYTVHYYVCQALLFFTTNITRYFELEICTLVDLNIVHIWKIILDFLKNFKMHLEKNQKTSYM
jgi:hypothetical protein